MRRWRDLIGSYWPSGVGKQEGRASNHPKPPRLPVLRIRFAAGEPKADAWGGLQYSIYAAYIHVTVQTHSDCFR